MNDMLLCVWPALNPLFIHVTFTAIVPGAYPGEAKMCLKADCRNWRLVIAILLVQYSVTTTEWKIDGIHTLLAYAEFVLWDFCTSWETVCRKIALVINHHSLATGQAFVCVCMSTGGMMPVTIHDNKDVHISDIRFGFGYKISGPNPNRSKMWHPCRRFSDRNCMQSAVQIKNDKNNFTCIQCADKRCFKHDRNRV